MRQRLLVTGIACVVLLAACGGSDKSETTSPPAGGASDTVAQKLAALEASGELPRLEREASLAGVDANADGVRDDIAAYIASLPDSPPQKKSLEQAARALTGSLSVDVNNDEQLRAAAKALAEAVACVSDQYGEDAAQRVSRMESLVVNTRERFDAYGRYNDARSGSVSTLPTPEESCK